jgi:translation initiation factor IF-2
MGGEVLEIEVSALKGTNLDKLLDTILLQAEVLDLKANPDREASRHRRRSAARPWAAVRSRPFLVQRGTLHLGDIFVAGSSWGRVRAPHQTTRASM